MVKGRLVDCEKLDGLLVNWCSDDVELMVGECLVLLNVAGLGGDGSLMTNLA